MSKFDEDMQPGEIENEAPEGNVAVGTGFFSGPGITNKPVEYVVVNGIAFCEGCVELGPIEEVEREAESIRAQKRIKQDEYGISEEVVGDPGDDVQLGVGLPGNSGYLWTNGKMPYVINGNLPNSSRVTQAIQHWTSNSGMRFIKRTAANAASYPNYVEFVRNPNENWSSSQLGMRGGRQLIRVSDAASAGTIIHEIGHAFGHYHEQSRSDRDLYVTIKWQNIKSGFEGNFQKQLSATDYYNYDYGSIMHYPTWGFSKNGQPTIVPLQGGVTIGQRTGLSFGDRLSNAKMYERFFKKGHSGVWRQAGGKYALWTNASWSSFLSKWQSWSKQGLRLTDLNVHRRYGQTRYSGVWLPGTGSYGLWANVSWTSFVSKWQSWSKQGLRLVDMNVHNVNGQNRYSGVFLPGQGSHALWGNASWGSFVSKWNTWSKQGLRLVDINVQRVNGQTRYSGVWLPGTGSYGLWANVSWASFVSKWQQWSKKGLRLVDMNVHRVNGQNRYSGVFVQGTGGYYLWSNVTWESFKAKWQQLAQNGQRLIDYEFIHTGDGPSYDEALSTPKLADAQASFAVETGLKDGIGGLFGVDELMPNLEDGTSTLMPEAVFEGESEIPASHEDTVAEPFGGLVDANLEKEEISADDTGAQDYGGMVSERVESKAKVQENTSGGAVFSTDLETTQPPETDDEEKGSLVLEAAVQRMNGREEAETTA